MLVECGLVRATSDDGVEFTFTPSLGRIATLGSPQEIVRIYADLYGPNAPATAAYVLACLCDQDDASPLIGWCDLDPNPAAEGVPPSLRWHDGAMPPTERVIIAQHLMRHGIIGKAVPAVEGDGQYSDHFDVAEYVAAARVHLGLSSADAEALSMTEMQLMLDMKFPKRGRRNVPTREEYFKQMAAIKERRGG